MAAVEGLLLLALLMWLAPILVTAVVARSRGRSLLYILWPALLGWVGAAIAIIVVLVQAEKRRA